MTEDALDEQDGLAEVLAAPPSADAPEAPLTEAQAAEEPARPAATGTQAAEGAEEPSSSRAGWSDEELRFNDRLNMSEAMLREQHGDADVDAKLAAFRREAQRDPGLRAALRQQAHPWAWMYRQAQRALAVEEVGADPDAYRSRVREEVRAELAETGSGAARAPAAPPRAPSLAAGRSSAPRGATWSGPAALDDILRR